MERNMKNHRGLTKGKSVLLHGMQQFAAFLAGMCVVMLIAHSFASFAISNPNYPSGRVTYDWNLFSRENNFDETTTFDAMLMNSLQEIIRYNVAKSQLEVNGQFDGSKIIDIQAFANRKDDLSPEKKSEAKYALEDLIKWNKYGFNLELQVMPMESFITYFGQQDMQISPGYVSKKQINVLSKFLGESTFSLLFRSCEVYGYDIYYDDAGGLYYMESVYDESGTSSKVFTYSEVDDGEQENKVDYLNHIYRPELYAYLADLLLEGLGVADVYIDTERGDIMVSAYILQERYKTVDEAWLTDIAVGWAEYWKLVLVLQETIEDLSYNYNEYLGFKERFGEGATNIAYTFEMFMMGEEVRVSNMATTPWRGVDSYFKTHYGRYLVYHPETMTFETNTGLTEEEVFNAFSSYEYAYPETAEIWLAVDTAYPVNDQFAQADAAYRFLHPAAYILLILGVCSLVVWLVLFLYLSVMTGYRVEKGEKNAELTLNWFDAIPTEIGLLLGGASAVGMFYTVLIIMDIGGNILIYTTANRMKVSFLSGIYVMFASAVFSLFWYSLIRRIKGHTIWKSSLLGMLWNGVFLKAAATVKKPFLKVYDNSSTFIQCMLPATGIIVTNFILGWVFFRAWFYWRLWYLAVVLLVMVLVNGVIIAIWFTDSLKRKRIVDGIAKIRDGEVTYQVSTEGMHGENLKLAQAVNSIGEGIKTAVETSMKDERLKADLITNVSHDIKTPLTSIINYVDLMKREKIETEPVKGYIEVLDAKSQRLKQLTDDLVEASKISSGNITLIMEKINLTELLNQSLGEFSEKFEEKRLSVIQGFSTEAVNIEADSRRIWRVVENLFGNIYKYALEGTRVYIDMEMSEEEKSVVLSIKNISAQSLNIQAEELTERFIRGDVSRSTEGSGLGLSIAKNLTQLQNGRFDIYLDGDLFKVTLTFPVISE